MQHVGFLIRLVAYIIDAIIIGIGSMIISVIFGVPLLANQSAGIGQFSIGTLQVIGYILQVVWGVAYLIYFWSSSGQTPAR